MLAESYSSLISQCGWPGKQVNTTRRMQSVTAGLSIVILLTLHRLMLAGEILSYTRMPILRAYVILLGFIWRTHCYRQSLSLTRFDAHSPESPDRAALWHSCSEANAAASACIASVTICVSVAVAAFIITNAISTVFVDYTNIDCCFLCFLWLYLWVLLCIHWTTAISETDSVTFTSAQIPSSSIVFFPHHMISSKIYKHIDPHNKIRNRQNFKMTSAITFLMLS